MADKQFATQEQIDKAIDDLERWEDTFPNAAEELKNVWGRHLLEVGHKRLGRALVGREVLPLGVR